MIWLVSFDARVSTRPRSRTVHKCPLTLPTASEKRKDAIHSHGAQSKSWIAKLWPSPETLDNVRVTARVSLVWLTGLV